MLKADFLKKLEEKEIAYKEVNGRLIVMGNLHLYGKEFDSLPDNMTIEGWVDLVDSWVSELPKGLIVKGWLRAPQQLYGTTVSDKVMIKEMPACLIVKLNLYLKASDLPRLPQKLNVGALVID